MELEILKKKLSSFKGEGGRVTNVSDDLLLEILSAWESWTGTAHAFYTGLGTNHHKMASMMGKAKKLKREGATMPFQEITPEDVIESSPLPTKDCSIEVVDKNKVIRFSKVDLLMEYLKKAS